ncbi:hypothetical protein V8C34DRAFT_278072 [Trichoderma compactum]
MLTGTLVFAMIFASPSMQDGGSLLLSWLRSSFASRSLDAPALCSMTQRVHPRKNLALSSRRETSAHW